MKKVILSIVLALSTLISASSSASVMESRIFASVNPSYKDPGDHVPWGSEIPFPWNRIQGTWLAEIEGSPVFFSFTTIKESSEGRQLRIVQYAPANCSIIASGVGIEEGRVVSALVSNVNQQTYVLTVHVFNRADFIGSQNHQCIADDRTITVVKMTPLGGTVGVNDNFQSYRVDRVSVDPKGICQE